MAAQQITDTLLERGINVNWRVIQAFIANLKVGQSRYFTKADLDVVISYLDCGTYSVEVTQ